VAGAKYCTILFKFTPMGIRKEELCEKSGCLLKRKEMKDVPWSFGSCHVCWKKVRRTFSDERKTPHPYQSKIHDPNLSVLGGYGCIICNGCVIEMEKYSEDEDDRCMRCPYCGHQVLELEIKHKHGGFNINYEKATVVWQQFGFGSQS
jgi:DNA-directed RNA polymerase subunit RPC12/RpoP